MELLARCIEWDDEKLKALQDEQSTLNEEIEKKNQLLGKIKERQTKRERAERKRMGDSASEGRRKEKEK